MNVFKIIIRQCDQGKNPVNPANSCHLCIK